MISGTLALALLIAAGLGVGKTMQSDSKFSDLALANVEALVIGEGSPKLECSTLCLDEWCGRIVLNGEFFHLQHCIFI